MLVRHLRKKQKMERYLFTEHEVGEVIEAVVNLVRAGFGIGGEKKAAERLEMLEMLIDAREVPDYALGWYVIDENGDPKCERFSQ